MAEQGAKGRKSGVYIKSIASRSRILVLAQRSYAERITNDLAVVFWQPSQMAITNHLATVFWLLSGMASRFTSRFISSFSTS
jgi:hypothetical protein